jgi:hypothetical protein
MLLVSPGSAGPKRAGTQRIGQSAGMRLRATWVLAVPLLLAALFAVAVDDPVSGLLTAAAALAISGLLHGLGAGPLPGTPNQNAGRVVVVAAAAVAATLLVGIGLLAALFSGLCDGECAAEPWRRDGLIAAAVFLVGAVVVVAIAALVWSRLGRARRPAARTPRWVALVPAASVAVVALVAQVAQPSPPRGTPPTAVPRVLARVGCVETGVGPFCEAARLLRSASSGDATLAVWRTADALRGVVLRASGGPVPVVLARGLPDPGAVSATVAVAALPDGDFAVGWTDRPAAGLSLARVRGDGTVREAQALRGDRAPFGPEGPTHDPGLSLAPTAGGVVALAIDRPGEGLPPPSRLRVLALDPDLTARGAWRTAGRRIPSDPGAGATTSSGGAAVTFGTTVVREAVETDADGRRVRRTEGAFVVRGPGGARVGRPPGSGGLRSDRYGPVLVDALRDAAGRTRSLWTTVATASDPRPGRVERAWVLTTGRGTPGVPIAEELREPQLVATGGGVAVLGLRPRSRGREADLDVVLVRVP